MATCQVIKEEFLTCIICHEVFKDPVTLHCGHTFCAQCVTECVKTQTDDISRGCISCPHCRGLTQIPDTKKPIDKWTGQLMKAFFVKGLVEKFAQTDKDEDDSCSLCKDDGETKPAAVWCSDCGHALCSDCQKVHGKLNKGHEISDVSEGWAKTMRRMSRRVTCERHPDFVIDMLCEDCDLAICQRCCTLQHRKCESVILLDDAVVKLNPVLEKYKKNVDKEVFAVQSEMSKYNKCVEMLQTSTAKAEAEIDSTSEKLISKIQEKRNQLREELSNRNQETLQCLKADIKSEEIMLEELKQRQGFLKHALESDVNTRYEAYKQFQQSDTNYKKKQSHPKAYEQYLFIESTDAILNAFDITSYGYLAGRTMWYRATALDRINTRSKHLYGITVMYPNGTKTLVVTAALSHRVKSFTTKGKEYQESTLQLADEVYGITPICNTKAAVCMYTLKQIVFVHVKPKLKVESKIKTQRSYLDLAYLGSETIAACAHFPGVIDIIDMEGTVLKSFGTRTLVNPGSLFAANHNNILVCDKQKSSVVLLSQNGKIKFLFEPKDRTQLSSPGGVAQNSAGDVFVVDDIMGRVIQLTETGGFLREVLTKEEGLDRPTAIFVDDSQMYVTTECGHICIYEYV